MKSPQLRYIATMSLPSRQRVSGDTFQTATEETQFSNFKMQLELRMINKIKNVMTAAQNFLSSSSINMPHFNSTLGYRVTGL